MERITCYPQIILVEGIQNLNKNLSSGSYYFSLNAYRFDETIFWRFFIPFQDHNYFSQVGGTIRITTINSEARKTNIFLQICVIKKVV